MSLAAGARFEREARAIASLAHPHICTLFDIGEHIPSGPLPLAPRPLPLSPVHYLVMEHLAGETLAQRLRRGPLPLAQALDLAAQIAEALDAAHKHGTVHRDLKPGNVMLTTGGAGRSGVTSAKLLDFGLAKLTGHGERPALAGDATAPTMTAPITERGTILGTLQYMAPEQLEGKDADARTDLWALGGILYEMVTGRRAFEGDSQVSLIGNIMNAEPVALATLQPLTPPALERVVRKCLAKAPDDRWDTAHDVADELRWIAQTSGVGALTGVGPRRRRALRMALAEDPASMGTSACPAGSGVPRAEGLRARRLDARLVACDHRGVDGDRRRGDERVDDGQGLAPPQRLSGDPPPLERGLFRDPGDAPSKAVAQVVVQPGLQAGLLPAVLQPRDADLNLAQREDAQVQVLLVLLGEPGGHGPRRTRLDQLGDEAGVEQVPHRRTLRPVSASRVRSRPAPRRGELAKNASRLPLGRVSSR